MRACTVTASNPTQNVTCPVRAGQTFQVAHINSLPHLNPQLPTGIQTSPPATAAPFLSHPCRFHHVHAQLLPARDVRPWRCHILFSATYCNRGLGQMGQQRDTSTLSNCRTLATAACSHPTAKPCRHLHQLAKQWCNLAASLLSKSYSGGCRTSRRPGKMHAIMPTLQPTRDTFCEKHIGQGFRQHSM